MRDELENTVARHYGCSGLLDKILQAVTAAGGDSAAPTIEDLAPVDEFHTAGRLTTVEAINMLAPEPGMVILDAGCGLGGTARYLASEYSCDVFGLDLTTEYVEIAQELTRLTGLTHQCQFCQGSVLAIPKEQATFDAAVSFHVAMNIEDRVGLYSELYRVLKPGAKLCLFDVMKGDAEGMLYPVPWAETADTSYLKTCAETQKYLTAAGFTVTGEKNLKTFARDFFRDAKRKVAAGEKPSPLGLHLLTGQNSAEKFSNYAQALEQDMIEPVILVARRDNSILST